jgi:hypothetical protein
MSRGRRYNGWTTVRHFRMLSHSVEVCLGHPLLDAWKSSICNIKWPTPDIRFCTEDAGLPLKRQRICPEECEVPLERWKLNSAKSCKIAVPHTRAGVALVTLRVTPRGLSFRRTKAGVSISSNTSHRITTPGGREDRNCPRRFASSPIPARGNFPSCHSPMPTLAQPSREPTMRDI